MQEDSQEHEALAKQLNDDALRSEYARPYNNYHAGLVARILGSLLIFFGNLVYGEKPTYGKFKAIEIIARIPYQSWEVATYTVLTALHSDEKRAIRLTKMSAFSRMAQDNETMHVVVISHLAKKHGGIGFFRHLLIPLVFAFFYFWTIYILYLFSRKASLELNYLFESHAYASYQKLLDDEGEKLRATPCMSEFLEFYGREARNEYEFFELVRNDELIHRNRSIREIHAART